MAPPAQTVGAQTAGDPALPQDFYAFPATDFELPWEVKHGFRTKALILASLETWIVLGFTIACDRAFKVSSTHAFAIMFGSLCCAGVSLSLFWLMRHRYPLNYVLLLTTTVLAGTFWAFTENSIFKDTVNMPVQVSIILATMITTWLVSVQVQCKVYEIEVLFFGLFMGWMIGSVVNFIVVKYTGLPPESAIPPTAAVLVSSLIILAVVAKPMLRCCADDYMIVAVAMTANLFLLVSIPVIMFLVSLGGSGCSCEGTGDSSDQEQEQQQQQQQQAPEQQAPEQQAPAPEAPPAQEAAPTQPQAGMSPAASNSSLAAI